MPINKNKIKLIHSLEVKKHRRNEQAFIAEGFKTVGELLKEGFHAKVIVATSEWKKSNLLSNDTEFIEVTDEELKKASLLVHPQQIIGIFDLPSTNSIEEIAGIAKKELCLCLDDIQDPGNLGTIIRTADWFGIKHIICSQNTVDAYNPKVVQSTMGSIARVQIHYTDIVTFLKSLTADIPIYGTMLDGENLYSQQLKNYGIIVMGNEGNGISKDVQALLTHKLLIPPFNDKQGTAESLNVSIATAIICSEFRRRC